MVYSRKKSLKRRKKSLKRRKRQHGAGKPKGVGGGKGRNLGMIPSGLPGLGGPARRRQHKAAAGAKKSRLALGMKGKSGRSNAQQQQNATAHWYIPPAPASYPVYDLDAYWRGDFGLRAEKQTEWRLIIEKTLAEARANVATAEARTAAAERYVASQQLNLDNCAFCLGYKECTKKPALPGTIESEYCQYETDGDTEYGPEPDDGRCDLEDPYLLSEEHEPFGVCPGARDWVNANELLETAKEELKMVENQQRVFEEAVGKQAAAEQAAADVKARVAMAEKLAKETKKKDWEANQLAKVLKARKSRRNNAKKWIKGWPGSEFKWGLNDINN
jgi:hypothetical protein